MLISIILEITLFNYTHYATLFTSKHFSFAYDKQKRNFSSNANEFRLNGFSVLRDSLLLSDYWSELRFKNLNTEIASIYINPIFIHGNKQKVRIFWVDEESTRYIDVSIIKDLNFSNYITITPRGKVSNLTITFFENNIAVKQVELNKKIPMAIMPIRMIIVFGISLLLLCLKNAELREKISHFCFDYLYDKASFRQRIGFAMLICSMLVFNFLGSYSVFYGFRDNELASKWLKMYSHHMTDALIKRQLNLDIKIPQSLLKAERPYDVAYRIRHGIGLALNFSSKQFDTDENAILGDHSYYKGKYYSYFGIVPVIILFAPYKLITGDYLPTSMGIFVFASMATILLMLLWRQIAQDYLKKLPYFFFLIGAATLYACSFIPIYTTVQFFHIIAQYSALTFVIFGVIILLQARKKLSIWLLLASSLSFAIAVACRPNALFWSLLIPVMLWDKRKELINAKVGILRMLAIIIPFVIVGSILAWYNYARFDSPFEFGTSYMLSSVNQGIQAGIIEDIHSLITTFFYVLFSPPNLDLTFPFVLPNSSLYFPIFGVFCFPVMWFLFYVRKVDILRNFIFAGIFISLLDIILLAFIARQGRYAMDFSWVMAIGALICTIQLQEKEIAMRKIVLKAFYSCCLLTLMLAFFLTIENRIHGDPGIPINPIDPKIQHYLARTFGDICNVP